MVGDFFIGSPEPVARCALGGDGEGLWCGELNRSFSCEYAPDIDAFSASGAYSAGHFFWIKADTIQTARDIYAVIVFTYETRFCFAVRYTSKNLSTIDAISQHVPPPWLERTISYSKHLSLTQSLCQIFLPFLPFFHLFLKYPPRCAEDDFL